MTLSLTLPQSSCIRRYNWGAAQGRESSERKQLRANCSEQSAQRFDPEVGLPEGDAMVVAGVVIGYSCLFLVEIMLGL